jgi:multidrug efflux system membrane fusion protein
VTITQIKPIAILFSLPQQSLPDLVRAMAQGTVQVQAMAADNKTVIDRGKVVVINNQVDPTTGTVQLKAEFPNPDVQLWPGQFINVRVLIDTLQQVVVVPTAAVQRGPDGTYVYVIKDDDTVAMRPVKVGQQDDQQAVIDDGLEQQERVVTTGFGRLAEGSPVETTIIDDTGQVSTSPATEPARNRAKGKDKRADASGARTSGTP